MFDKLKLRTKLIIVSSVMFFISGTFMFSVSYITLKNALSALATHTLEMKLEGDIHSSKNYLHKYFGNLKLSNGMLIDCNGKSIENRFDMVDVLKNELNVIATVFVFDGNDFTRIITNIINPEGKRAVGTKLGTQSPAFSKIKDNQQYIGHADILGLPYLTAYDPIVDSTNSVIGILFIGIPQKEIKTLISNQLKSMAFGMISITLLGIVIFATIILLLLKKMIAPLTKMGTVLTDISAGNLTKRFEIKSNDEIGIMATQFNRFLDILHKSIADIVDYAKTLASSAKQLSDTSRQISLNSEKTASQSVTATSETSLASSNINNISSSAEQMSSSANTVAAAMEQMQASLTEVAKNCQKELQIADEASKHASTNKETMDHLGTAAKSIGKVIEIINDIADQINLLALNATIEAASAGSAGKGFAVVANEVKELAKQTAHATHDIEVHIAEMQNNTESAIKAIDLVAGIIDEVNSISHTIVSAVEEQNFTVNEISKNVNDVSLVTREVAKNVTESANGLNEVTRIMSEVNGLATDTHHGVELVKTSANELSDLSNQLKSLLNKFTI